MKYFHRAVTVSCWICLKFLAQIIWLPIREVNGSHSTGMRWISEELKNNPLFRWFRPFQRSLLHRIELNCSSVTGNCKRVQSLSLGKIVESVGLRYESTIDTLRVVSVNWRWRRTIKMRRTNGKFMVKLKKKGFNSYRCESYTNTTPKQ